MEINGRQCEEVKIGKNKYYFLTSYKGKEYRKIMEIQFSGNTKIDEEGNFEMDASKLVVGIGDLFPVLCIDIVKGEEHTKPTSELLDELDVKEYVKIQNILTTKIGEVMNSKKA